MINYFIKVSDEFQLLEMFLNKCTIYDNVIVEINSMSSRVPEVITTCDKHRWVRRRYSHLSGYRSSIPGYETVDLTLLGSNDSSNIWVSKVFGIPSPFQLITHETRRVIDMNPLKTLS